MDRVFRVDFYPHEWLTLTGHMNPQQKGIFIDICSLIYAHRGPIINDASHISRVSNCDIRTAKAIIAQLTEKNDIQIIEGMIHQKRCIMELEKKKDHLGSSSRGGKNKAKNASKNNDNSSRSVEDQGEIRGRSAEDRPSNNADLSENSRRTSNEIEDENNKNNNLISKHYTSSLNSSSPSPSPSLIVSKKETPISPLAGGDDLLGVSHPHKKRTRAGKMFVYTPEFERFWQVYPRNAGSKYAAMLKFDVILLTGVHVDEIIAKAQEYANFTLSECMEARYICYPATWLNQRRWESDYTTTLNYKPKVNVHDRKSPIDIAVEQTELARTRREQRASEGS